MDEEDRVLTLRLPPEPRASRDAREAVGRFARAAGVGADDLDHFLTALGEALANAIEHAGATEESILVEVRVGPDRIVASVEDRGVGFVPQPFGDTNLPDPTAERGRGIPIIRRCSDIFALTSAPGKGTAVVLGRYFCPRPDVRHVA